MVTQEILNYIRQQLVAGVAKEDIKNSLIANGWAEHDIQTAFSTIEGGTTLLPVVTPIQQSVVVKKRQWPIIASACILLLILAGGGAYFHFQKTKIETTTQTSVAAKDTVSFDDSDMKAVFDTTQFDCSGISSSTPLSDADLKLVEAYSASTSPTKASVATQKILNAYSSQIDFFLNQGTWAEHAGVVKSDDTFACSLNSIRLVAYTALAEAKSLASTGDQAGARAIITGVLENTQKFQDNPQGLILYLVGVAIKGRAIDIVTDLKDKGIIKESDYKSLLEKYSDNETGHKMAIKYEYTRTAQLIDDLGTANYGPAATDYFGQEFITSFKTEKTDFNFETNNTNELFYALYKDLYSNIDKSCGSTYDMTVPVFDPNDTGENYLGRGIFAKIASSTVTLNTVNRKRCALDDKFSQF